jgi:hypothetical protein
VSAVLGSLVSREGCPRCGSTRWEAGYLNHG